MPDTSCEIEIFPNRSIRLRLGGLEFASETDPDEITHMAIARLDRMVHKQPEMCEQADLRLVGKLLFRVLFSKPAREVKIFAGGTETFGEPTGLLGEIFLRDFQKFETACDPESTERFRLNLHFHEGAGDVAAYPWELLHVTSGGKSFFLGGQNTRLILTRSLPPVTSREARDRLVVWVAWAQPKELEVLPDLQRLPDIILDKLGGPARVELVPFPDVTWKAFKDAIETGARPDIIHLIGHGKCEGSRNQVAFKKTADEISAAEAAATRAGTNPLQAPHANWVDAESIAAQLEGRAPSLFFLHSCNTARSGPGVEGFRGAAQQIANAGVPFVIAMQYAIENEDAKQFARQFYDLIGKGGTLDDAVKAGRQVLGRQDPVWGHRRFATPVVFLRSRSQALVRNTEAKAPTLAGDTVQLCPYCFDKQVASYNSRCPCSQQRALTLCGNRHVNQADAVTCARTDCGLPLRTPEPARPAAASAAPSPDLGVA